MKYLLLFLLLTSFSIFSQAQNRTIKNVQVIDSVKLNKLESEVTNLKLSHDSILAQNENLKIELSEHRLREGFFSDVIGGVINWFSLLFALLIAGIGWFSWNRYKNINRHVQKEITKSRNEIASTIRLIEDDYKSFRKDIYDKIIIVHSLSVESRSKEAELLMEKIKIDSAKNQGSADADEVIRVIELYISICIERINIELIRIEELQGQPSGWVSVIVTNLKTTNNIMNFSNITPVLKEINLDAIPILISMRDSIYQLNSHELEAQLSILISNLDSLQKQREHEQI